MSSISSCFSLSTCGVSSADTGPGSYGVLNPGFEATILGCQTGGYFLGDAYPIDRTRVFVCQLFVTHKPDKLNLQRVGSLVIFNKQAKWYIQIHREWIPVTTRASLGYLRKMESLGLGGRAERVVVRKSTQLEVAGCKRKPFWENRLQSGSPLWRPHILTREWVLARASNQSHSKILGASKFSLSEPSDRA